MAGETMTTVVSSFTAPAGTRTRAAPDAKRMLVSSARRMAATENDRLRVEVFPWGSVPVMRMSARPERARSMVKTPLKTEGCRRRTGTWRGYSAPVCSMVT